MSPTQIGKYQINKLLGQGGFGAVYLATDPDLNTQVAIKVFNIKDPELAQQVTSATSEAGKILKDRFLNEARILRQLASNANIVDIYEFATLEDGTPYYVMPYLIHSLSDDIGKDVLTAQGLADLPPEQRPRKLPVSQAMQILQQVLSGLKEVHQANLIHRDIKPANILFDQRGNAQLCDFGIAKAPDVQHSQTGMAMGSRNYMSPEQRESAKYVTAKSDVFSVGVLAYRMLTGTLPKGRYDDPITYCPNMGDELNQLILSAINEDQSARPADAGEFLKQLQLALKTIDENAPEVSEDTATEFGDAPQAVSNKLRPLQEQIKALLLENVELGPEHREPLEMSAGLLGLDNAQLDHLIAKTEKQLEPELEPLRNFINVVNSKLAQNNGELPEAQQTMLLDLSEQNGQNRATLEKLLKATLAKAGVSTPQLKPEPVKPIQQPQQTTENAEEKPKSKAPLVGAAALVLLAGGGGYLYTQNSQTNAAPVKVDRKPAIAVEKPKQKEIETNQLWVETNPKNAKVILPDIGPAYSAGIKLSAGKYRVKVKAPGYITKSQWVDLSTGNQTISIELVKKSKVVNGFVDIPAGRFQMGSGVGNEKPIHTVHIKSFYLQEREVTFAEWDQCVSEGGCSHKPKDDWGRGRHPVMGVSYDDITLQYIPWLNKKTGHNYRLPTESEWEYAARAASAAGYSWGDEIGTGKANCDGCGSRWDNKQTAPVKSFQPNQWGLYDMHGNVWEWTEDCWHESYVGAPGEGGAWIHGDCSRRVLRGGSWDDEPKSLRSANRDWFYRTIRRHVYGFRLARDK